MKLLKKKKLGETFSYRHPRAWFVCMSRSKNESNDFCSSPRVNFFFFIRNPILPVLPLFRDRKGSSGCCASFYLYSRLMSSYSVNVVPAYNRANNSPYFIWCRQDLWKLNGFDIWAICGTCRIREHKIHKTWSEKSVSIPVSFFYLKQKKSRLWLIVYT